MTDREAFIEAIAAAPEEDTPRLAFADWLDEHGEQPRAEFVRLQCRLARARPSDPETGPALERVKELFARHGLEWLRPVCAAFGQPPPQFPQPRGFVGRLFDRVRGGRGSDILDQIRRPQIYGSTGLILFDLNQQSPASAPLRFISIDRGFFTHLFVWADGTSGTRLRDVLRVEPVVCASVEFLDPEREWDRMTGPHLRRLRQFYPSLPGHPSAAVDSLLGRMFNSDDLAGVTDFGVSLGPGAQWHPIPVSWVRVLARSKMGSRLERLALRCSADAVAELGGLPPRGPLRSLSFHGPTGGAQNPGLGSTLVRLPFRDCLTHLVVGFLQAAAGELEAVTANGIWPRLESLDWSHNDTGDRAAEILARSSAFPALTQLKLDRNGLTDHGARVLAGAAFIRQLRSLGLGYQDITDSGAVVLAEALAGGAIESLEFVGSRVTEAGRRRLTEILGPNVDVRLNWV